MTVSNVSLSDLIEPARTVRAGSVDYPILSMTMREGLIDQSSKFKKRVASADTSGYKVVAEGQLVVGFPIDEGVLAFQDRYPKAAVSPAYEVWDLRCPSALCAKYIERFLKSPSALSYFSAKLRGTTARRRSVPRDVFLELSVPLPSLAEQRRIADVLQEAEGLQIRRREALAMLDELEWSTFLDLFGDPAWNPKWSAL